MTTRQKPGQKRSHSLRVKVAALGLTGDLRRVFWVLVVFSAISNFLMLSVPLYMLQIYDRVLVSQSLETLLVLTLIVVIALVVFSVLDASRSQLMARISARLDQTVTGKVTGTILNTPSRPGEDHANPLRDIEVLKRFVSGPSLGVFFDAPWAPFFLGIVYLVHPVLGMIAIATAVVLVALAYLSDRIARENDDAGIKKLLNAKRLAESSIRSPDVVSSMGMGARVSNRVTELSSLGLMSQTRQSDVASVFQSLSRFVRLMAQVGVLGGGAWLVLQQEITAGAMIASSLIMGRGLSPAEKLIGSLRGSVQARRAFNTLSEFLIARAESTQKGFHAKPQNGDFKLSGVDVFYPQTRTLALAGLDLTIKSGQAIGFIGPNAAGKSTLARVLAGALLPNKGQVSCGEIDYALIPPAQFGNLIGYLPQDVKLLDATIHDNISRFATDSPEAVIEAAKLVGLHEFIMDLPDAYETVLGEGGARLSGGRAQLLGLARAIYAGPSLVILDEPNANLDSEGEAALNRVLSHCKSAGTTVVIVSHKPTTMQHLDVLHVLQNGRIQMSGPPNEIHNKLVKRRTNEGLRSTPFGMPMGGAMGGPSMSVTMDPGFGGAAQPAAPEKAPGEAVKKPQEKSS